MKMKLSYKRIAILLTVLLMIITGFLWYKDQNINKEAPKRANLVINNIEWWKVNG